MARPRLSRADLLLGAGSGAALLASGGVFAASARAAGRAVPDGDLSSLRVLIAAELLAADFAAQARVSGRLAGASAALVKQLHADDAAHYAGLAALLSGAGQTPATADDIDFAYPAGSFASTGAVLRVARKLATLSLGAYLGAIEVVQTPELRLPLGQIAANEAQHVSALAHLLGSPPVGRTFATALRIDDVSSALDAYES